MRLMKKNIFNVEIKKKNEIKREIGLCQLKEIFDIRKNTISKMHIPTVFDSMKINR